MATTVKGFLKGLRYITQIFDEEKDQDMQIGFPTDVKHVAHIGSDGPAANMPSWMGDFKPQENENSQVVSRDGNNNKIGEGVGLQELLPPPEKEKPKQKKTRRKSENISQNGSPPRRNSNVSSSDMIPVKQSRRKSETISQNGSPPRRHSNVTTSDMIPKQSKRNHQRSRHGSIDSSNDPSVRRRHRGVVAVSTEMEGSYPLSDGSGPTRKSVSRNRKLKGSGGGGGELSMKAKTTTKGKTENSTIVQSDKCNDNNISDKD